MPEEELLYIVLRHWRIIMMVVVFSGMAAFIYLMKATPIYTSTAQLYFEKITRPNENLILFAQPKVIKSSSVLAEIFENSQIRSLKTFINADNPNDYLRANLNIAVGKRDGVILISFNSPYPEEASLIVNSLVNSYIAYYAAHKQQKYSQKLAALQKKKDEHSKRFHEKLQHAMAFAREHSILCYNYSVPNSHFVFNKLNDLSNMLTNAKQVTMSAKANLEAIQNSEPTTARLFAMILSNSNTLRNWLLSDVNDITVNSENSKSNLNKDDSTIVATNDKLKRLLAKPPDEFVTSYMEALQLRLKTAKQKENELLASFQNQQKIAQSLSKNIMKYSVMRSELTEIEKDCRDVEYQIKQVTAAALEDGATPDISILEAAVPASIPSRPEKTRIMTMALTLGLIVGGTLAVLRNYLESRQQSAKKD